MESTLGFSCEPPTPSTPTDVQRPATEGLRPSAASRRYSTGCPRGSVGSTLGGGLSAQPWGPAAERSHLRGRGPAP